MVVVVANISRVKRDEGRMERVSVCMSICFSWGLDWSVREFEKRRLEIGAWGYVHSDNEQQP